MKYLQILFAVLFISSSLSGQIEYEALPPHNPSDVTILHVENEECLGVFRNTSQFVYSEDLGETWSLVHNGDPISSLAYVIRIRSKEYIIGIGSSTLYKLDIDAAMLDSLTVFDTDKSFIELGTLPNGNFIARGRDLMKVYDEKGVVQAEWSPGTREIMDMALSKKNRHVIGVREGSSTPTLVYFDSNLSIIEDLKDYPIRYGAELDYDGDRLYSNNGYTDDGKTYTTFPNDLSGTVTLFPNGRVHLIASCRSDNKDQCTEIYISDDRGESFVYQGDLSLELAPNHWDASVAISNESLFLLNVGTTYISYFSEDGISDWSGRGLGEGQASALWLEAARKENLFLTTSGLNSQMYYTSDKEWKNLHDDMNCVIGTKMTSAADGSWISNNGCHSDDEGKTWSPGSFSGGNVMMKDEIAYTYTNNSLQVSEDYGRSWTETRLDDIWVFQGARPLFDVSSTGYFYQEDSEDIVRKYDLKGNLISDLNLDGEILLELKTAYKESVVYAETYINTPPYVSSLQVSFDDAETFVKKPIPINDNVHLYTDHLGHLFIYSDRLIMMSDDHGDSWIDMSPEFPENARISFIDVSWDNYLFVGFFGYSILRSSEPILKSNTLRIKVYDDQDGSCTYDSSEPGVENIFLNVGGRRSATANGGNIDMILPLGDHSIEAKLRSDLYESCNNEQKVEFRNEGENAEVFIPINILERCADLTLETSIPLIRRCFDNKFYLEISNDGSESSKNATVRIELDEFFDFLSCDFPLISTNENEYIFELGEVPPRSTSRGVLNFNLSCDADLGRAHYTNSELIYDNPCNLLQGQSAAFECQENRGSYDPNDKRIFVDGFGDKEITGLDSEIEYLIRFQNTGTDTAFTVRVEDNLTDDFDPYSLRPVAASHDYTWEINRNNLIVIFNEIDLVDSTRNEQDSHGFIKFRAQLKAERPEPGAIVENTAKIYFDFNDPIVTNTVETYYLCKDSETKIEDSICAGLPYFWPIADESFDLAGTYSVVIPSLMGCDSTVILQLSILEEDHPDCMTDATDEVLLSQFAIFPNPAQNSLSVIYKGNEALESCTLYNLGGAMVLKQSLEKSNKVDLTTLEEGLYILDAILEDGRRIRQRVVIVR